MPTKETPEQPTTAKTPAAPERVYVEIPRAKPGQGYHAPKNYNTPLLTLASKVAVVLLCLTLPGASGLIFGMIYAYDPNARAKFLWIWIPLTIFILLIACLVAVGVAREALEITGVQVPRPHRAEKPPVGQPAE